MWKAIWEFINSNWGTSIIGGILTGFLVTMLWEWGKRFRERRHYLESIELGNEKIFDIIESSISEKQFLSDEVLLSLPKSISKECKVHIEDLAPLTLIIDCVIKKIIESNFLSNENKIEYSNNLIMIRKRIEIAEKENVEKDNAMEYINMHLAWLKVKPQTKKVSVSKISITVGAIASYSIFLFVLWSGDAITSEPNKTSELSPIVTATVIIALIAAGIMSSVLVFRTSKRIRSLTTLRVNENIRQSEEKNKKGREKD
ncbi:hypothetical protein [Priestia megaterium]|uniref:hypothetical protein n=1 Tax=Priestia megaterium TaxID=1404 RepID=UPI0027960C8A|nr:hypothetical protein [Priestia megaterium]